MKIFIDAGHNDSKVDTGAVGFGIREQDITFNISKLLGEKLTRAGVLVGYSRNNKTDIIGNSINDSLNKRAKMANDFKADLFISIHTNSHEKPSSNGTEVYVYNEKSKALPLAEKIQKNLVETLGTYDRKVKTAGFTVLANTNMPALLIETAFISNASDNAKLKNNQEEIAETIFKAICEEYGINIKKYETPVEIVDRLSVIIEIQDKKTAVKQVQKAKEDNNSLYWILYKIANN